MTNKEKIELMRARERKYRARRRRQGPREGEGHGEADGPRALARPFDAGTFVELDRFVEHRCVNFGMDKTEVPGEGVVTDTAW